MIPSIATTSQPRPHLGRYELIERLGRGGMAEVYKARLPGVHGVDKLVALKRILPEVLRDPKFVEMFVREARLCTRLTHPNLIQVFEFGQEANELYLAMELVDGCDLRRVLQAQAQLGKPMPTDMAIRITLGVLHGLDYAHRLTDERGNPLNVVHRDLSPANVLLSYVGAIKVADFGVAHVDGGEKSDANLLKGKLSYMSPEQLAGQSVDARADVFAAACVLYEMLAGEPVYGGKVTPQLIRRVARGEVPQVRKKIPSLDPALAEVLQRAMMPDRATRIPSCERFATELMQLVHAGRVRSAREHELALYLQVLVPRVTEEPLEPEPEPAPSRPTLHSERPPPSPLANLFDSAELELPLDPPAPIDDEALVAMVPAKLPESDEPLVLEELQSEVVELRSADIVRPAPEPAPKSEVYELGEPRPPREAPVVRLTPGAMPALAGPVAVLPAWPVVEQVAEPILQGELVTKRRWPGAVLAVVAVAAMALVAARLPLHQIRAHVAALRGEPPATLSVAPAVQAPAVVADAPASPARAPLHLDTPQLRLELPQVAPSAPVHKPVKKLQKRRARRGTGLFDDEAL